MAGNVVVVDKDNFKSEVLESDIPVLVDFWAEWCGPCKMVAPIVDQVADEMTGKAKVCKLNVDNENELAVEYKVMSIPTLIVFKGGSVVEKSIGAQPKAAIIQMLEKHI